MQKCSNNADKKTDKNKEKKQDKTVVIIQYHLTYISVVLLSAFTFSKFILILKLYLFQVYLQPSLLHICYIIASPFACSSFAYTSISLHIS